MIATRGAGSPVVGLSRLFVVAVSVAALVGCAGAGEPAAEVPAAPRAAAGGGVVNTAAADRAVDGDGDAEVGETDASDLAVLFDTDHGGGIGGGEAAVLFDTDDGVEVAADDVDDVGGDAEVAGGVGDTGDAAAAAVGGDAEGAGGVEDADDGGDTGDAGDGGEGSDVRFVVDGFGGVFVEDPCGGIGPVCPLGEDVAPINAGGPLVFSSDRAEWGPWVGRVLDMCNDNEAHVAVQGFGWWHLLETGIDYSTPVSELDMDRIHREREFHPIVCSEAEAAIPRWKCREDDFEEFWAYMNGFEEPPEYAEVTARVKSASWECWDAAAEQLRYVYVTTNGPRLPQSSVEAAVEDYEDYLEREGYSARIYGERLGFSGEIPRMEMREDSLVVVPATVSVTDGVLRGLAQNRSERLWARNVIVTVSDPTGSEGEWRFPLTVQPGEPLPFEIENWAGTRTPAVIDFTITADLSPTIDLTRSLGLRVRKYVDTEYFYFEEYDYPEEMGAFPDGEAAFDPPDDDAIALAYASGTMQADGFPDGFYEWVSIGMEQSESSAHPWLAEATKEQTIENLTVYAATHEDGVILDVFELTPMVGTATPGEWTDVRTIPAEHVYDGVPYAVKRAFVGVVGHTDVYIWAGGVTQGPRPLGDESQ